MAQKLPVTEKVGYALGDAGLHALSAVLAPDDEARSQLHTRRQGCTTSPAAAAAGP